jgi:two-component system alkaline phosphatase synthesis response regulator PhoP
MSLVYILEDDESIAELVKSALELSNINVKKFFSSKDFFAGLESEMPDMTILDIMLPDNNGLEVLSQLKMKYPSLPVIFLSAMNSELDKVKGLELGAEDYITKPFGIMELVARVKTVLRRSVPANNVMVEDDMWINTEKMTVIKDEEKIILTPKEFQLLIVLIENKGKVLKREDLLNKVWGYDYAGETRTVDNHIKQLRNKTQSEKIDTVFGVGYRWKEE